MFALIWAILLIGFSIIVFSVRQIIPGITIEHDARFWIVFLSVIVAFIGNLVCACYAFRADSLQKLFYNIPLITISYSTLIAMMIIGSTLMLIPNCPAWVAIIVCVVILAFSAIAVIQTVWASGEVQKIDENVKAQTSFIKNLIVQAESILANASAETIRSECKKVRDAVRYSDPMSNSTLSMIETKITVKMDELSAIVGIGDAEKVKEIAGKVVVLLDDRNKKCRALR
ncbi:MAG: hypothetical protein ACOX6D_10160 [Thermoguttaceae bacterium]